MEQQSNNPVYRSASHRASLAIILMAIIILFSVINIVSAVVELIIYSDYSDDQMYAELTEDEQNILFILVIVQMFRAIPTIAFMVYYCSWKHLVYKNLQAAEVQGVKHSPGWAVGWYFIPIVNMIKPHKVMQELWKATFYADGTKNWKSKKNNWMITCWWLAYIVSLWIIGQNQSNEDDTIGYYRTEVMLIWASDLLWVVSGALLIVLIKRITEAQDKRFKYHKEQNNHQYNYNQYHLY
jgi:hypothetical protein